MSSPNAHSTEARSTGAQATGWRDLIAHAAADLLAAGVDSPQVDAEMLAAHVLGLTRNELLTQLILGRLSPESNGAGGTTHAEAFHNLVDRRARREPLQHLTGWAAFRHLEVAVGPGVFVPRPETEVVAQQAIDAARRIVAACGAVRVVDLCTGSGALALAIADEVPEATVWAVELDAAAFAWAQQNIAALAGSRDPSVTLVRGDARRALTELNGTVDVVVSNPPYVPSDAIPRDLEVQRYDPPVALYGLGADGLEVPRGVVQAAARLLRPGGIFVMEHAEVQAAAARELLSDTQWDLVHTELDLAGRPRMVVGERAGACDVIPDPAKDSQP